ncbi:hypothetical protein ACFE04_014109 [Oxalis oulophora]
MTGPMGSITSATLKKLNLSSNKLSGSLPTRVGHCAIIDLSNNMLTGNLSRIQSWGNYVEVILLSSNKLSGILPNLTSQFLRLTSFKVSNNSLEGILPPVLSTFPELKSIDLSLNDFNGLILSSFFTSTKLTDLNLSSNNFSGTLPLQEIQRISSSQNLSLMSLDLSSNSLSGNLPPELSRLNNLIYLDLSQNNFQGSIPVDLPAESLQGFNVSLNNLSGVVPENLRKFPGSSFHPGNSLLIFPNPPASPGNAQGQNWGEHGSHMKSAIRISLISGLVGAAVILLVLSAFLYYRARWHESRQKNLEKNDGKKSVVLTRTSSISHSSGKNVDATASFSFQQEQGDTSSATRKSLDLSQPDSMRRDEGLFSPTSFIPSSNMSPSKNQSSSISPSALNVYSPDKLAGDLHLFGSSIMFTAEQLSRAPAEAIGRSCHGTLYKATLDVGNILAVKWLREGIAKRRKEFAREVKKLGNIRHPNLVSVQGYYWGPKEHEKLIISKYVNAECLALYLQEPEPRRLPFLSLAERLKIAKDVAQCLDYLHNERAIPHGNLKSTNILIETPNVNALLTDYSLHRILTPAGTAEQVLNAGALGYRPPEFASSSKPCPSLKSDVYAYGVILLELLTGKLSGEIVSGVPGVADLTDWVLLLAGQERCFECFDRRIVSSNEQQEKVVDDMLEVALKCILPASERPDMKSVYEDMSSLVV